MSADGLNIDAFVAVGDDEKRVELAAALKAKLNASNNGERLQFVVQRALYFMMAETITTMEEVEAITIKKIAALAKVAYESADEGSKWTPLQELELRAWAADDPPTPTASTADDNLLKALGEAVGARGGEDGHAATTHKALPAGLVKALESEIVLGEEWHRHLVDDLKSTGLTSGASLLALSASMEVGVRVADHTVSGLAYGTDVNTLPTVKDARKHNTTYSKLIATESPDTKAVTKWEAHLGAYLAPRC